MEYLKYAKFHQILSTVIVGPIWGEQVVRISQKYFLTSKLRPRYREILHVTNFNKF